MKGFVLITCICFTFLSYAQTKDSVYQRYYLANSFLLEEGAEINKLKEGVWKEYEREHGLKYEWTYLHGIKNGKFKVFHSTGKLEATGTYKSGQLNGKLKVYNSYGKILYEMTWKPSGDGQSSSIVNQKNYKLKTKPNGTIQEIGGIKLKWENNILTVLE